MVDQFKPFVCTYQFDGRPIGITIHARSFDEVSPRLRAIGMTARIDAGLQPMAGQLRSYACCYEYEGHAHGLRVDARSRDDATARFRAIGTTGIVAGELVKEIDAGPLGASLGSIMATFRALREGQDQ